MDTSQIIGLLHLVWSIVFPLYFIMSKTTKWDWIFIYYILGLYLSWTFFNGECLISYIDKWLKNKDYKAGDNPIQLDDYNALFGKDIYEYTVFPALIVIWVVSIWIVFKRNRQYIPISWTIGILILLILYLLVLRLKSTTVFKVFNEVFKMFLVVMITIYTQALMRK